MDAYNLEKVKALEAENAKLQRTLAEMAKGEEEWLHWKAENAELKQIIKDAGKE